MMRKRYPIPGGLCYLERLSQPAPAVDGRQRDGHCKDQRDDDPHSRPGDQVVLGIEREGIFVTYDEYRPLYEKAKKTYLHKGARRVSLLP